MTISDFSPGRNLSPTTKDSDLRTTIECRYFLATLAMFTIVAATNHVATLLARHESAVPLAWTFLASSAASIVGFAYSPLAGSVIFHFVGDHLEAISILLVSSIALQSDAVAKLRKHIRWKTFAPFLAGGLIGLAPGMFVLTTFDPSLLPLLVGGLTVTYGLLVALGAKPKITYTGKVGDIFVGFLGGLTGPIAAFPGAFVTMWCSAKDDEKIRQRATYQPFILAMQVACVLTLCLLFPGRGLFNAQHLVFALPAILGSVIGIAIFHRLSNSHFQKLLGAFLFLAGCALLQKGLGLDLQSSVALLTG